MNMIKTLATKMVAILALVALLAPPATAQGLSAVDMALAFGGSAPTAARSMSTVEMDETEGAWAKIVIEAGKAAYRAHKAAKAAEKAAKNGKKEHITNQRPSNLEKHQNGQARAKRDQGREKGDQYRKW